MPAPPTDTHPAAETLAALRLWLLTQEVGLTTDARRYTEQDNPEGAQISRSQLDVVQAVFDVIGR